MSSRPPRLRDPHVWNGPRYFRGKWYGNPGTADPPTATVRRPLRRLLIVLPLAASIIVGAVLAWSLTRNPREIPSALVGKPVPAFDLPAVKGRSAGLSSADLAGEVSLVNVFASWCTACREEHPLFMALKVEGAVPIHGLNYKDKPADAAEWLGTLGDPYTRTGADRDGRVAIDWGVYGEPETFVVSATSGSTFSRSRGEMLELPQLFDRASRPAQLRAPASRSWVLDRAGPRSAGAVRPG